MPNINFIRRMNAPVVAASSLDADYIAWRAAVGSVGATQETATNALIVSLKAHSLWTVHDRIWLLAAENSTQALTDIKSLSVATNNGSTFTASQGYAGNASSTFVDTNFATSTGTNFTQNSASYSVYVRTNRSSASNMAILGSNDNAATGNGFNFFPHANSSLLIASINGWGFPSTASTNAQGFYTVSRTGSTTVNVYKNSSSSSIFTDTTASTARDTTTVYVGGVHLTGAGSNFYSDDQAAIVTFGAGLSNTDAAQLQTDLNAYMTALGTNVY